MHQRHRIQSQPCGLSSIVARPRPSRPRCLKRCARCRAVQTQQVEIDVPLEDYKDVSSLMHAKLDGASVAFHGDDGALNDAVAHAFATLVQYAPLATSNLIEQVSGQAVPTLEEANGRDSVVVTEATVLEELAVMVRCSISSLGGGWGAAARGNAWRHLYGHFNVWLDVAPGQDEEEAPQRGAYADAELHITVDRTQRGMPASEAADEIVAQVIPALLQCVHEQDNIVQGKALYKKLGCRGDWPDIQHPDWQPPDPEPVAEGTYIA